MTARPIDIGVIVGRLSDRILALCLHLFPQGTHEGQEFRVGDLAGSPGRSLMVHLSGTKAGVWADFSAHSKGRRDGHAGDALDLVAQALFRGDKKQAVKWSLSWLGMANVDPATLRIERAKVAEKKHDAVKLDARRTKQAFGIFVGSEKTIQGTPAETYLRSRGIDFARLGRMPGALRFNKSLADAEMGVFWPTLVCAISEPKGNVVAIHRHFLDVTADGRVVKADLDNPKQSFGRYVGGCIRLWRGASGKGLNDAVPGEWVMIGEGLEDTASAVMEKPELRALCAVSLSNMGSIILPPAIEGVILIGQNDPEFNSRGEPHPARGLFDRAVDHFLDQGKRVKIARPPPGIKDVNELLTAGGNAA